MEPVTEEKREVPPTLKKILQLDVEISKSLIKSALNTTALRSLKKQAQLFEWSCHGILWLAGWMAFIWIANKPSLYQIQANLLFGLILDIIAIVILKAFVRRRRPSSSGSFIGPDKYSFPSGHASRVTLIAFIFTVLQPVSFIFFPAILAWVGAVCLTRILLERHYILDILGGIGLGILEGITVGIFWFSQESSAAILSFLSDEKLDGGEYHV